MNTIVLDAGAVTAIERRNPRIVDLLERARRNDSLIVLPAAVVAETWRGARTSPLIARLLNAVDEFSVLDPSAATRVGSLLAQAGLPGGTHIVDGSVVDAALGSAPCLIATSDPDDIRRLLDAAVGSQRVKVYAL
jgi:hypothetical protein